MIPSDTNPALARALAARNYTALTPVQSAVLAPEAAGRDILVSAQTGSGKTVAFGLAFAADVLGEAEVFGRPGQPQALVVAPTRELALQVARELGWLYGEARARIVTCVGGMDAKAERRRLADGAHVVVGTPGRLRDHIERGGLDLSDLKTVVLDEADEMLDMGFREDLEFILDATPAQRRSLLFSATMPKGIAALAARYQSHALRIEVAGDEKGHADIEYRAVRVTQKEQEFVVVNLLRFFDVQTAIVFCNTRESVRHLQATLQERGFSTVLLSGELSQHERNQSMQALRDGRARVCVATDVAARGIDLPNLGLVIHAELPHDAEALQHRSGRTGRAGNKGVSAILVPYFRRRRVEFMLRDAGVTATWQGPPSAEEIGRLDEQRLIAETVPDETPAEEDVQLAQRLLAERTPEQLAAALARLYRSRLPSIEEVTDPGEGPLKRSPRETRERRGDTRFEAPQERIHKPRHTEMEGGVEVFRLNIGRVKNADPKWLLPMLCRNGGITRDSIGRIKIFDHETRVEIARESADGFATAMNRPGGENIRAERLAGEAAHRPPGREERPKKFHKPKFSGDAPRDEGGKAHGGKAYGAPRFEAAKGERPEKKRFNPERAGEGGARPDKPKFSPKKPRKG